FVLDDLSGHCFPPFFIVAGINRPQTLKIRTGAWFGFYRPVSPHVNQGGFLKKYPPRVPDAMQRFFSGAAQSRDPQTTDKLRPRISSAPRRKGRRTALHPGD